MAFAARFVAGGLLAVLLSACGAPVTQPTAGKAPAKFAQVDQARLAAADREPDQWFTPGRDTGGTYYSPLDTINDRNVAQLGFAWEDSLGTTRGLEATPIVVDGVLYTSGNWGRVYAIDAATGRQLWTYDPGVPGQWARYACCDVVNRGVAVLDGRVYVASLDGYLHAIDAKSGQRIWRVDTLPGRGPKDFHYFVTGAPLIAGGVIVIGNGGGDFSGARGSVSAYDLRTGAFRWRFYTVPRDPRQGPQDQPHLQRAMGTWDKNYNWDFGGGGSVWDGMAYDPALNLVYLGTGNASPYAVVDNSRADHDQLYIASILAIHADSGQLAWHFQEIPGEGWDYDTTAKMVLTDLPIGGHARHVLMQASKDGYLYVLDRVTGEVLAAHPFEFVNWTKGLDPSTYRPLPTPAADWMKEPKLIFPGASGAHNWQPMSFSPKTGLIYIPVIEAPMVYVNTENRRAGLIEGAFDLAFFAPEDYDPKGLESLLGKLPPLAELDRGIPAPAKSQGVLRAVNPLTGRVAWEQIGSNVWDGGVLSTGGNLVFRGDASGQLGIYAADSGRLLRKVDVGTSIMAAPMTYRAQGQQFIAVMAGFGGGNPAFPADSAAYRYGNSGRIVAFRLGGGTVPQPAMVPDEPFPTPAPPEGSPADIARGEMLYNRFCGRCHVFGRGLMPDLRRLTPQTNQLFYDIVLNGLYQPKGMARWDDVLSRADAGAIHAYVLDQAWQAYQAQQKGQKQ
jgi:quinohemoprotein ethanol dehydrogenase